MNIAERLNRSKTKIYYYEEWGRGKGDRASLNIFTYLHPKNQLEKNHNAETFKLLAVKKSEAILDQQATGSGFIPAHRFKANFLEYYAEYVKKHRRKGSRHLQCSFNHFKTFLGKDFMAPIEMTEDLATQYRQYLLDHFTGDTPANYFSKFKKVIRSATREGYFRVDPGEDIKAKANPSAHLKENLEVEDYIQLLKSPCLNLEVKEAFILSCYAGLRWCDVEPLQWDKDIRGDQLKTRLVQAKTKQPIWITLHPIARAILEKRKSNLAEGQSGRVFRLPSHNKANQILQQWVDDAGINKHITWHCARLSFSILLQDKRVDAATVAALLGHTSTKYVDRVYKRHRPKDESAVINLLPNPEECSLLTASPLVVSPLTQTKVARYTQPVPVNILIPSRSISETWKTVTG